MEKVEINVIPSGQSLWLDSTRTFLTGLYLHGYFRDRSLCAGIGRCANCGIGFSASAPSPTDKDADVFTPYELQQGWRLACEHTPGNGQIVEIPSGRISLHFEKRSQAPPLFLVVDIGTTTVKWSFEHTDGLVSSGSAPNPQSGTGGEIMSRLRFALESPEHVRMQRGVLLDLFHEILALLESAPDFLLVSGNPAMLCLFLEKGCSQIARAPYTLPFSGDTWVELDSGLPQAYIPPLISPFIGADITCGLFDLPPEVKDQVFLFADFGTNAEMVLCDGYGTYYATSVAMGPALEGCGLRFGAAAGEKGVCSEIILDSWGIRPSGKSGCTRITATAYLDVIRKLKGLGILDDSGRLTDGRDMPLASKVAGKINNNRLYLTPEIFLDPADVQELLMVKAAFTMGLESLLNTAGLSPSSLTKIYIAGSLGQNLAPGILTALGFLPQWSEEKIIPVGNSSLSGGMNAARQLPKSRERMQMIGGAVHSLDLTRSGNYNQTSFARHMRLAFTCRSGKTRDKIED